MPSVGSIVVVVFMVNPQSPAGRRGVSSEVHSFSEADEAIESSASQGTSDSETYSPELKATAAQYNISPRMLQAWRSRNDRKPPKEQRQWPYPEFENPLGFFGAIRVER